MESGNIIILDDFNAHNILWNCKSISSSGSVLAEVLIENDFYVINFDIITKVEEADRASSNIDLLFCSGNPSMM